MAAGEDVLDVSHVSGGRSLTSSVLGQRRHEASRVHQFFGALFLNVQLLPAPKSRSDVRRFPPPTTTIHRGTEAI